MKHGKLLLSRRIGAGEWVQIGTHLLISPRDRLTKSGAILLEIRDPEMMRDNTVVSLTPRSIGRAFNIRDVEIIITVVDVTKTKVRLAIRAPRELPIFRLGGPNEVSL